MFIHRLIMVDSVMQRQHIIYNQTLKVMRFQVCLGKAEDELAVRKLRIPDAIFVDADPSKIRFMKASKANKEAIEAQLQTCNTAIVWPNQQQENVMLECTITLETQYCYRLVKTWREEAQKHFEDFMKLITVHKVPIPLEVWQKVMDGLKTVGIDKLDAVTLFVDRSDGAVTIVGFKPVSDSIAKIVNDVAKKVVEEAERERQKENFHWKGWWGKSKEKNWKN